jgi:hypothetical protein
MRDQGAQLARRFLRGPRRDTDASFGELLSRG